MINDWKHGARQKSGGGIPSLSFDWQSAETGLKIELADERSPDRLFDREWARSLPEKVLARLEATCHAEGNAIQFDTLKSRLTADSSRSPYTTLAAGLGMSEGAARVAVHRLRKRYRHLLTEEIIRTLSSPAAVEEEMQSLFAAIAGGNRRQVPAV